MTDSTKWPAFNVERKATATLVPYARNSRTHSDEQVSQIAASIKEWGFTTPILIDEDNGIIAGHGRLMAAQRLGLNEVPCIVAANWTDAQKRAYVIADNKLALNAGWDNDMLAVEFGELKDLDFDVSLIGFTDDEINKFIYDDVDDNLPDQKDLKSTFEVAVECDNEEEQEKVFNLLKNEGYQCRILTM